MQPDLTFFLERLISNLSGGVDSALPPQRAGGIRVPVVRGIRLLKTEPGKEETTFTLGWEDPDVSGGEQVSRFIVQASESTSPPYSTTLATVATNRSPASISVPVTTSGLPITLQVFTILNNGFSSREEYSPKISGVSRLNRRVNQLMGATVASANDLALGVDGNFFQISGSTTINGIATFGWLAGAAIVLKFLGSPTVTHNGSPSVGYGKLMLSGAANMSAASGNTLSLIFDGTDWFETSRKT